MSEEQVEDLADETVCSVIAFKEMPLLKSWKVKFLSNGWVKYTASVNGTPDIWRSKTDDPGSHLHFKHTSGGVIHVIGNLAHLDAKFIPDPVLPVGSRKTTSQG